MKRALVSLKNSPDCNQTTRSKQSSFSMLFLFSPFLCMHTWWNVFHNILTKNDTPVVLTQIYASFKMRNHAAQRTYNTELLIGSDTSNFRFQ